MSDDALIIKHEHWGYRNPSETHPYLWYQEYPKCAGLQQSPIDIDPANTEFNKNLQKIQIKPLGNFQEAWTIINNGHTVQLRSNKSYEFKMNSEIYSFQQMHFHWRGSSEHKISGRKLAGELHLVHMNLNNTGKYSVIGFLFQVNLYIDALGLLTLLYLE